MRTTKMSFENLQNELSVEEMRCIMAGSAGGADPGGNGGYGIDLPPGVIIRPDPGTSPNYPPIIPGNPSMPVGGGSGGGYYPGPGNGQGQGGPYDNGWYYGDKPIDQARNFISDYERGSQSWQYYSENAMNHKLSASENSWISEKALTLLSGFGFAVDSHNLTTGLVSFMSREANTILHLANKTTGMVGIALGGVTAATNIYNNGGNTGDWIAIGLSMASLALLLTPAAAGTAAGVSLITGVLSFTNDAISIAGGYN